MKKIGITGGIGSGKTTICKVFELLDVPVYYADNEAKKLLDESVEVKGSIAETFGNTVLNESGLIDKKKLADVVFNDPEQLKKLNSIVHPAVREDFEKWLAQHSKHEYIIEEAAILFESGAYKLMDGIIAIVAPRELKIKRVMQRDNVTAEQVEKRMQNQMSDDEREKRSQFKIMNNEQQLVIPQILRIHKQLTSN